MTSVALIATNLYDRKRLRRGKVSLGIPHPPRSLDLLCDELLDALHFHGAVYDSLVGNGLEIAHLEHDDLNLECQHDVGLGEGANMEILVVAASTRFTHATVSPAAKTRETRIEGDANSKIKNIETTTQRLETTANID